MHGVIFVATLAILRTAQACSLAILMPRFIEAFPQSKDAALTGTVDLWFIVHDGGILLLTAYLLLRNRVWCKCRLRVFVVTGEPDTNGMLKKVMTRFIYDLRISAEVEIVEMVGFSTHHIHLNHLCVWVCVCDAPLMSPALHF